MYTPSSENDGTSNRIKQNLRKPGKRDRISVECPNSKTYSKTF